MNMPAWNYLTGQLDMHQPLKNILKSKDANAVSISISSSDTLKRMRAL